MMRAPRASTSASAGVNMTPMIDIVFQLIIFFLLASHFARQDAQLELLLPEAETGQSQDAAENRRLVVNVLDNGDLVIGGATVAEFQLGEIVTRAREKAGKEPLEVRIRSDRHVPYGFVEPILVACAKGGVWNVSFAVTGDARRK